MKKIPVADNAGYVYPQISFLDDSGCVRKDCISKSVLFCYLCDKPIPRFHPTLYYLAGSKPKRICRVCYKSYKQTFDIVKGGK